MADVKMAKRAHKECMERAEYGDLMRATNKRILERLERGRSAGRISQQRLAEVIGVNREAMRDRLSGRTQLKAHELAALAAFLDIAISEFFHVESPD